LTPRRPSPHSARAAVAAEFQEYSLPMPADPSPFQVASPVSANPTDPGIAAARQVLALEADALTRLIATVESPDFARTLDLVVACEGRVIVTGMGKSGHIARKIAATLASTGTPAFFIHPSEASHGDLGMIAAGDLVVALSNSGDTLELADILAYTRRYGQPLVGITARRDSTLARYSDCLLLLPPAPEACPHGLAPTTSTTMMLALGDALAIALLDRRGFSRDDYGVLHPGGALGRRLRRVRELMHGDAGIPLVDLDARVDAAILEMTAKRFGCVGLTASDGRLAGIITDGDLRRHMSGGRADQAGGSDAFLSQSAARIMTAGPRTIRPDALVEEALQTMNAAQITSLFVVDGDDRPLGILHVHDCLRAGLT
jgi:arabinose-5-phosphate isomerase